MKNFTKVLGGLLTMAFLMVAAAGFGQAMKITSNGNVGVGIANPVGKFHVVNVDLTNQDNYPQFYNDEGVSNGFHQIASFFRHAPGVGNAGFNVGYVANGTAADYTYLYGPGEKDFSIATYNGGFYVPLYITNDGMIGINNTGPNYALDVVGDAYKSSGTSSWNIPSDKRLKKNINKYGKGLADIMAMRPVEWKYNGKAGTIKDRYAVGLIAQDYQKIAPEFVDNYTYEEEIIEDSGIVDDLSSAKIVAKNKEEILVINDSPIKYMLVNAVQEQQAIIEEQEDRIAKLEDMLTTLIDNGGIVNTQEVTLGNYSSAELMQNSPNPFGDNTAINYVIPSDASSAKMEIFDMNGRLMKSVNINHVGEGQIRVNAQDLSVGTYNYRLIVDGGEVLSKKMIINR